MPELRPGTANELAEVLRACERKIALRGAGSQDARAGVPPVDAIDLRLDGLAGIEEYDPRDLTLRVAAGTRWRELTRALAAQGQMIPLDPVCAQRATVGGVVASNSSGPRRRLYGTARDMVIGMTLATLDGALVKTGAMVVKNVAGLDTQKALIGSFGTLAAIASVNFRVFPRPEASRTFLFHSQSAAECAEARDLILQSPLQPAAVDALNAAAAGLMADGASYLLAVRASGSERTLARYTRDLDGAVRLEGDEEPAFWEVVQEFATMQTSAGPESAVVRVGHRMGELAAVLESTTGPCLARAGNGVAYLAFHSVGALKEWLSATSARGWSRVVEWSGERVREQVELWPEPGDDFAVMQRLKQMFDPRGLLNPGRLYGRL